MRWLQDRGVDFRYGVRVDNLHFASGIDAITANGIDLDSAEAAGHIELGEQDKIFVTNGSMTADKTFGSTSQPAPLNRSKRAGAWQL